MKYYILQKNGEYQEVNYQQLKKYYYNECIGGYILHITNMTKEGMYFSKIHEDEKRARYPEEAEEFTYENPYPSFS
jgi:hypothetical protein